jgi:hypothetical protein
MQNYRRHVEEHLLPAFEPMAVADIQSADVDAWEKRERAAGYAESSIRTWRATLHLILADAVEEGLRESNPAARRRGRGKRAGRSRVRAPEKAITSALGVLLIAERAALLSGRDDEFVAIVLKGSTRMRWGELVGLARTQPKRCPCHERVYAFGGHRPPNGAERRPGASLVDSGTFAADRRESWPRTGGGTTSLRGCSDRRRPAGIRARAGSWSGRCRCSVSRGPAYRCGAEMPPGARMPAGCRSRRA